MDARAIPIPSSIRRGFFAALLFLPFYASYAGWETRWIPAQTEGETGRAVISYYDDSRGALPNLETALQQLIEAGQVSKLSHIWYCHVWKNEEFQKELVKILEQIAPREWAAAKKSAGNMHNPKMEALREPFRKAVLTTPTVLRINMSLSMHGLKISDASFEKLMLSRDGENRRISCALWLVVRPK